MTTFRDLVAARPIEPNHPLPAGVTAAALRTELAALANPACPSGMPPAVYARALAVDVAILERTMRTPRAQPLGTDAAALISRALDALEPAAIASKLLRDEALAAARAQIGVTQPGPLGDQLRNALRGTLAGKVRRAIVELVSAQPALLESHEAAVAAARAAHLPATAAAEQVREARTVAGGTGPTLRTVALEMIGHALAAAWAPESRPRPAGGPRPDPSDVLARAFALAHLPAGSLDRPSNAQANEAMAIAITAVVHGSNRAPDSVAAYLLANRGRIVAAARREARWGRLTDVEDIAQETTARLLSYLSTNPGRTHTAGLVDTLAARVAADMYRAPATTVPFSALAEEGSFEPPAVTDLDAADLLILGDHLTRAIDAEVARTREVDVGGDEFAGARRAERLATLTSARMLTAHLFSPSSGPAMDPHELARIEPGTQLWQAIEQWVGGAEQGGPPHRVRQVAAVLSLAASVAGQELAAGRAGGRSGRPRR